jgi:hypothetical protein
MEVAEMVCYYGRSVSLEKAKEFVASQLNTGAIVGEVKMIYEKRDEAPEEGIYITPDKNKMKERGLDLINRNKPWKKKR